MSPYSAQRFWSRNLQRHAGNYTHVWARGLQSKECRPAILLGMGSYTGGWGCLLVRIRHSTKATGSHPCSVSDLSPFLRNSCIRDFKAFHQELSSSSHQTALSHCQYPISKHPPSPYLWSFLRQGRSPLSIPSNLPYGSPLISRPAARRYHI